MGGTIISMFISDCQVTLKQIYNRDSPKLILGRISLLPNYKMSKNFPTCCHSQLLSSTFWWNFHENPKKIAKLQIHETLHKSLNENRFHSHFYANVWIWVLWGTIKATNMLKLYTANFDLFKKAVQYQFFPILVSKCFFPQIQQTPIPNFRMVGKSLNKSKTTVDS